MIALPLLALLVSQPSAAARVNVRITQKYLVARCLDDAAVGPNARSWTLAPGEHTLVMTMDNQPRTGVPSADPGVARVRFTLTAGHRYEVETRAPSGSYSTRVWKRGLGAGRPRSNRRSARQQRRRVGGGQHLQRPPVVNRRRA